MLFTLPPTQKSTGEQTCICGFRKCAKLRPSLSPEPSPRQAKNKKRQTLPLPISGTKPAASKKDKRSSVRQLSLFKPRRQRAARSGRANRWVAEPTAPRQTPSARFSPPAPHPAQLEPRPWRWRSIFAAEKENTTSSEGFSPKTNGKEKHESHGRYVQ